MLRPTFLLDTLRLMAQKLDPGSRISRLNDGRLFHILLTDTPVDPELDPDAHWACVVERVKAVCGEGMIDWEAAKKMPSMTSSRSGSQLRSRSNSSAADEEAFLFSNPDLMGVSLLVIFISTVIEQRAKLQTFLATDVGSLVQTRLENIFKSFLDNRNVMTKAIVRRALEDMCPESSSTSHHSATSNSESGGSASSSFTYSPKSTSTPKTPLSNFFSSPQTTQIVKLQKALAENTRSLRQTRMELDQEKAEGENLKQEVSRKATENDHLKRQLKESKDKLTKAAAADTDAVSPQEVQELKKANANLRRMLGDKKDEGKYYKEMGEKYENLLEDNRKLQAKVKAQNEKLTETSSVHSELNTQLIEYQTMLSSLRNDKNLLQETVEELQGQVTEMQAIKRGATAVNGNFSCNGGAGNVGNRELMDISCDDSRGQLVCLSPPRTVDSQGQEVIGHTVILELQGQVAKLEEDLTAKKSENQELTSELNGCQRKLEETVEAGARQEREFRDRFAKQEEKIGQLQSRGDELAVKNQEADRKIASLQKNCELSHQSYLNEKQNSDEKMAQVMELSAKLKDTQTQLREESAQVTHHKSNVEQLQGEVANLEEARAQVQAQLETESQARHEAVRRGKEAVEQARQEAVEQAAAHQRRVDEMEESARKTIGPLKEKTQALEEAVQESEAQLDHLRVRHEEAIEVQRNLLAEAKAVHEMAMSKAESNHNEELRNAKEEMQAKLVEEKSAMAKMMEEQAQKAELELVEKQNRHAAVIAESEKVVEELNLRLESEANKLRETTESHANILAEMRVNHEEALKSAESNYNEKLEQMNMANQKEADENLTKANDKFAADKRQLEAAFAEERKEQQDKFENQYKLVEELKENLSQAVAEGASKADELSLKLSQKEDELSSAKQQATAVASENMHASEMLQGRIDGLKKQVQGLKTELREASDKAKADDEEHQNMVAKMEGHVEDLNKNLATAKDTENDLLDKLRQVKDTLTEKESEHARLMAAEKQCLKEKSEELEAAREEVSDVKKELLASEYWHGLTKDAAKMYQDDNMTVEKERAELENQNNVLKNQLQESNENLEVARDSEKSLAAKIEAAEEAAIAKERQHAQVLAEQKESLECKAKEIETANEQVSSSKERIAQMQSMLDEISEQLKSAEEAKCEMEKERKETNEQVTELKSQLEDLNRNLVEAQNSEQTLFARIEGGARSSVTKEQEFVQMLAGEKQSSEDKAKEVQAAKKEVNFLNDRVSKLQSDLDEVCQQLRSAQEAQGSAEKKLEQVAAANEESLATANQELRFLKDQLQQVTKESEDKVRQLEQEGKRSKEGVEAAAQQELAAVEKQLSEEAETLRQQCQLYEEELLSVKAKAEELKDEGLASSQEVTELRHKLATETGLVDEMKLQLEQKNSQLGSTGLEMEKLREEVAQAKDMLVKKDVEVLEPLTKQLEKAHTENETLEERQKVLQKEIEALNVTIKKLNDILLKKSQGQVTEMEAFTCKLESLEEQLVAKDEQLATLSAAKATLGATLAERDRNLAVSEETVETRTLECKQLMSSVTDLQKFLGEAKDEIFEMRPKIPVLESEVAKVTEEKTTVQTELEERIKYLEAELKDKDSDLEAKVKAAMEEEKEAALKEQKQRYEGRVKDIAENIKKQYGDKINEAVEKWREEVAQKNEVISEVKAESEAKDEKITKLKQHINLAVDFEEKYNIAKEKLREMAGNVDAVSKEKAEVAAKYQLSKEAILNLQADLKKAASASEVTAVNQKNDMLQRELNMVRNELRSLKVQNMAADQKIRELQLQQHEQGSGGMNLRRQTLAPPIELSSVAPPTTRSKGGEERAAVWAAADPEEVNVVSSGSERLSRTRSTASAETEAATFKMPCVHKRTPGRAKQGRTQSEMALARRPPIGSGSIFQTDDEEGEQFSNSYLTDMKAGRCSLAGAGSHQDPSRLSELARRNTMVPDHLKSSYPAETQFFKPNEFSDLDLKRGQVNEVDVSLITNKTAEISFDSPALNTRKSRLRQQPAAAVKTADSPDENSLGGGGGSAVQQLRKRRSTTTTSELRRHDTSSNSSQNNLLDDSNASNTSTTSTGSKRTRRDQNLVSYSRPGPPTPARTKGNKSINSSDLSISSINSNLVTPAKNSDGKSKGKKVTLDKTPLLDSTNQSAKSSALSTNLSTTNKSLRSLGKTPMSLRKVMTRAFRKSNETATAPTCNLV